MYARPQPCVLMRALTVTKIIPFIRIGKFPVRVRDIAVMVDTTVVSDGTNYYQFQVVQLDGTGAVEWGGEIFPLDTGGMRANVWKDLLADAGTLSDTTLALRCTKVASPATLTGLAISFALESRYDSE